MTPITERFVLTGATANLVVSLPAGTIRLAESDDTTVTVEIEGKGQDQIEVTAVGDDITIATKESERKFFGMNGRVTVRVQMPAGSDLRVNTASADVYADVLLGEVKCNTASGDIRFSDVASGVEVKSASGDVTLGSVNGALKASLASGDVTATTVGGSLNVNTASGDVTAETVTGDVTVKSASGDVHIATWTGSEFIGRTVSGDASVGVPRGTRASLNLKSLSGDVHMPSAPAEGYVGDRTPRRISFTSVSGDFHLNVI